MKNKIDEDFMKDIMSQGIPKTNVITEEIELPTGNIPDKEEPAPVSPTHKKKRKKPGGEDYTSLFLEKLDIKDRQSIYVEKSTFDAITNIVSIIGGRRSTISSFVTNVLNNHIEEYREVIKQLYESKIKDRIS